ncbi:N-acetylneuraminate synthase (EC [uncultured Gammaproteobacteria bacterium]|jgi:N-acetylneuraminate synthase|nr:N-acetylneuraminate synthase (EC [uncultured Gammaproteobacteria bacterium]VVM27242.1 N-acetylneuraminate synthase (EC [uncultured Gammaproteobacteria bacterium]
MNNEIIKINNKIISNSNCPYIIAELSANHNGSIERAFESVLAAKEAGADAVKIQTYTADTITIKSDREEFQIKGGLWDGYDLYSLYQEAETPYEWHKPLFDYAKKVGITIFSSPFDFTAVDLLEELNTPAYKIASPEIIDLPLIKRVAQTKKPMIISTGMANLEEISEAVEVVKENGCQDLILLHCISGYPTPPEQSNLRIIADLAEKFNVLTGLSDHTMGTTVATTSVALGACVIEKHFTLSRADKGPDSEFSLEPHELRQLCQDTEIAWESLGVVDYKLKNSEKSGHKSRRSLYVVQDIKKGEKITKDNIKSIRPGLGLRPKYYEQILGEAAKFDIASGTPLSFGLIA